MKNPLIEFPAFRCTFTNRLSTVMAQQMMLVVISWQMYDLTGSAYDLGMVGLAQFLPALILTLPAGHAADRFNRRAVLLWCCFAQLVIAGALTVGTLGGWLSREAILIASVVLGMSKAFQTPAMQAIVPQIVPRNSLPRVLAVNASGMQLAVILGPAIGGFIYVAGAHVVYSVCGALFVIAMMALIPLVLPAVKADRQPVTMKTVFAGISFIWHRKEVLGAISLDLFAVLLGGAVALLPIYAKDILHVGPWGLGILRSAPAVGALSMSLYLAQHPIQRRVGKVMFGSVAVFGLATLVFALSTSFILSLAALAVSGMFDMISVVIRQSLVQLDTPDDMRGRVSAVNSIFIGASNQLGEFESGLTASWFGTVPAVAIGGLGTLAVVAIWMKLFPTLTQRDKLVMEKETVQTVS
jgi:MFS family permease